MTTVFDAITEELVDDFAAIRSFVSTFSDKSHQPKLRIASANAATLLVAATFEEFAREMAREFARAVVMAVPKFDLLPKELAGTAWKRTMDGLGKIKFDGKQGSGSEVFGVARARFSVIYEFCTGDLTKDIYRELIHNENNMRPREINGLFKVSGLSDVCAKCSDKGSLMAALGETEPGKAHGRFLSGLDDFFDRRNDIAHSLNLTKSSGPEQIIADINMLEGFARALCETLGTSAPPPYKAAGGPTIIGDIVSEATAPEETASPPAI